MSKFELTFADWDACAAYGDCDSHISSDNWGRGQQPVINVTWDDAQHYVAWLSQMTGKTYRLLSEAEYDMWLVPRRKRPIRGVTRSARGTQLH